MIPAVVCTDNDNNCEIYVNFTFSLVENLSKNASGPGFRIMAG
jgi:hypothetical protein